MKAATTFIGGMRDAVSPEYLEDTQYVRGVNGINRRGHWQTRPDIVKVLDLPTGRFQGLFNFQNTQYAVVNGQIYRAPFTAPVPGVSVSPLARMCQATETEHFLVISDGVGSVVAVGDYANRAMKKDELTNVGLLTYGQGRIFFTDRSRTTLMAGDIYIPGLPDTVLGITEQQVLNEGLYIRQPAALGKIQAMRFMRGSTGTGTGTLIVFHERGACAYSFTGPRASVGETAGWLDSQIGQVLFQHEGSGGQASVIQINNDLFYREAKGVTTLRAQASQAEQSIRSLPVTASISELLSRDALWTLDYLSAGVVDNRVLYTHGLRVDGYGDYYFDSLLSVDLASFYASQEEAQVTFDGFWTGHKYLQVLAGQRFGRATAFIVTKGTENTNQLSVLSDGTARETPAPRTRLYTKRYFLVDAFSLSKLDKVEFFLENMKRDTQIRIYYRGESGIWYKGGEGTFKVPYYTADPGSLGILPQARTRVSVSFVTDICDPLFMAEANRSSGFQFCIEMRGSAELTRIVFVPKPQTSPDAGLTILCERDAGISLTNSVDSVSLYDYDEIAHSYYELEAARVKYI